MFIYYLKYGVLINKECMCMEIQYNFRHLVVCETLLAADRPEPLLDITPVVFRNIKGAGERDEHGSVITNERVNRHSGVDETLETLNNVTFRRMIRLLSANNKSHIPEPANFQPDHLARDGAKYCFLTDLEGAVETVVIPGLLSLLAQIHTAQNSPNTMSMPQQIVDQVYGDGIGMVAAYLDAKSSGNFVAQVNSEAELGTQSKSALINWYVSKPLKKWQAV